MKQLDSLSGAWSARAVRGLLLGGVLLGGVGVIGCLGCLGCGPVANFGSGSETMGSMGSMGSTGTGGGMMVSSVGVTGSGGVTGEGSSGTSSTSGSSGEPMVTATAATTTCSGAFLCEGDMFLGPECDLFAQDCPEGQKCAPIITDGGGAWNSDACVPVTGTDMIGDPCTAESVAEGLDSCVKGVMCWYVDMNGDGTCVAHCGGAADAPTCPDNGSCTIAADAYITLCIPDCDPLFQDCAEGAACYPLNDGFQCAPDGSGDMGKANDPCEFINVCDAGLLCGDPAFVGAGCPPGSTGCCTPFCEFPDGACPNPDQECVQWFDPAMLPEGDPKLDIGACGVAL